MSEAQPVTTDRALAPLVEQLLPLFYSELRGVARNVRRDTGSSETLCTTALVNEAYLKLRGSGAYNDRRHFLCAAALAMRQVLVDYARGRLRDKRGGGAEHVELDDAINIAAVGQEAHVVAVHEALERLSVLDPRMARVVECRFFAGYDEAETAEALGVSERTVRRDWTQAKIWLYRELRQRS